MEALSILGCDVININKTNVENKKYKWCAYTLPSIIFLILSTAIAIYQVNRETKNIESTTFKSYGIMHNTAFKVLSQLDEIESSSCSDALPEIIRIGGLATYVRSVGFIEGNVVYCSSIYGNKRIPLTDISNGITNISSDDYTIKSIKNTNGIKSRPAIIYIKKVSGNNSTFVILDSQYLIDIMDAITEENNYKVGISIGSGFQIKNHEKSLNEFKNTVINGLNNELIDIKTYTPLINTLSHFIQNFIICIPFSILSSYLLINLISKIERKNISLPDEIEKAMQEKEFYVNYQPVFDANTGACTGAEALLRWKRPDGRSISPDVFITAAENDGKIVQLTQHLFELIKKDVISWSVPKGFYLGVNISPLHITFDSFTKDVLLFKQSLAQQGLKTILEITERSAISDNDKTKNILEYLRKKGMVIAIDDFGTGYCSLSYLEAFPVDYLKIDKSFIDTIETSKAGTPILDMIINLAKQIGLEIVAEGVETEYQFKYLKYSGVSFLQGYYFSPPIDSRALMLLMEAN